MSGAVFTTRPETEVRSAAVTADGTDEHYDAEDLAEELGDPRLELSQDSVGVWSRGELIGYAKATGLPDATDGCTSRGRYAPTHAARAWVPTW
ncbi:hypothetical protein QF037_001021 [Streptomyces canus]|uniref:hypothetical protein n=1 Tax=Streptomyces canus TaxID=58343 RepID=UPI0027813D7A|nr:hypothetical protein [Streptomyces canus]MDQ0596676.1 hypothetical protein [Streptomyces canus]